MCVVCDIHAIVKEDCPADLKNRQGPDAEDWYGYGSPVVLAVDTEGTSPATSGAISVGQSIVSEIDTQFDDDWFSLSLTAGQQVVIGMTGLTLSDPFLRLRDSSGTPLASDDNGGPGRNSAIIHTAAYTGTYYVDAQAYSNEIGTYELIVVDVGGGGTSDDFAGNAGTTGSVSVGGSVTGDIEIADDTDWFEITLGAGETVTIDLQGNTLPDTVLRVFDANGNQRANNDDTAFSLDSQVTFTAATAGTYYLEAAGFGTETGTYTLSVSPYVEVPFNPLDTINWGASVSDPNVSVYFAPAGVTIENVTSEGFNAYEISQFQAVFDLIETYANVNFSITQSQFDADFRLALDTNELGDSLLGYFYPPGQGSLSGVGVFNGALWDRTAGGDLEAGGLGYVTIAHELLHGLGLAHPHDARGTSTILPGVSGPFGSLGQAELNQGVFTTMTYNDGYFSGAPGSSTAGSGGNWGHQIGPMALDIALLQQFYGARSGTAAGNDTYVLPGANGAGTFWQAIWDTGGADEIVNPGNTDSVIDLRPATLTGDFGGGGYISAATGVAGGFTIANGVTIENARGGGGDDTLIGNAADNLLRGFGLHDALVGGGGNDTLEGGDGNDTLNGGSDEVLSNNDGADVFRGGAGSDWVSYEGSFGSLRIDLQFSGVNTFAAAGDTYDSIENVVGSQGADNIRGTIGEANHIIGGRNVDYIFGRSGDDTLEGGIGDDVLFGGVGVDVLIGGANRDRAQYSEALSAVNIDLMNSNLNTGEAAGDTYDSIEDLAGGFYADSVFGDLGDNRLFGRAGNDSLYGRDGNDYLNGGANNDRLDGGLGDDTLRGGQNADTFVFNGGADVIEDFNFAHNDRIAIDDNFVTVVAGMSGADIVSTYGSVVAGNVVLNFDGEGSITIESLNTTAGLDDEVFAF